MNTRVLVASAFAVSIAAPALLSAQKPAEMPSFKAEKCYGIAKAGKNDCAPRCRMDLDERFIGLVPRVSNL